MKILLLVRHAKSDWGNPALEDFERPLNEEVKKMLLPWQKGCLIRA